MKSVDMFIKMLYNTCIDIGALNGWTKKSKLLKQQGHTSRNS